MGWVNFNSSPNCVVTILFSSKLIKQTTVPNCKAAAEISAHLPTLVTLYELALYEERTKKVGGDAKYSRMHE